ncbi:FxsA family protein [Sporolactobacillus sp. THM7-4]|nr:FxsA family protein [Sporolactobacillus sp. THM7-4]
MDMFRKSLIAVLLFVLAEICVILLVEHYIGSLNTFLLILLSFFIGIWLVIWQGVSIFKKIFAALSKRQLPEDQLLDGACLLFTGFLLAFPGFISDVIGIVLFVPYIRALIRNRVKRWLRKRMLRGRYFFTSFRKW